MKRLFLLLFLLISFGSVYAVDVDDTTGVSITTSSPETVMTGLYIESKTNDYLKSIEVASGVTATTCYLKDNSPAFVTLATTTDRTGDVFTFTPYQLTNTNNYYIVCDSGGSSYLWHYSGTGVSFPYVGTNIDIEASSYNGGTQTNRVFMIDTITTGTVSGSILTENIQDYYSNENVSFQVNLTPATNLSYIFNGGTNTSLGSNSVFNLSLTGIEGQNTITFYFDSPSEQFNFTIDTNFPTINIFNSSEINTYNVDWTTRFNYSDENINTCSVTVEGNLTNCTNYEFTYSGNRSVFINITDLAGNSNTTTYNQFVNPYQFFYFDDSISGTAISNFNFNGYPFSNYAQFKTYNGNLSLGSNKLLFTKAGYSTTNITFSVNNESRINQTFDIDPVTIYAKAYDIETLQELTFNVSIENVTNVTVFNNLTELFKSFSEVPTGQIKLRFESSGYEDGIYYNTLTPTSGLVFNIYLTPVNSSSIITFKVEDFDTGNSLDNVIIEAQKIINGSRITIQQTITTSNGNAYLLLDGLEDFNFIFSLEEYAQSTVESIPGVTSYTIRLQPEEQEFTYIDDITFRFIPSNSFLKYNVFEEVRAFISGTGISSSRLKITSDNGTLIYNNNSINPTGTTFVTSFNVSNSSNTEYVVLNLTYIKEGLTKSVYKKYTYRGELKGILQDLEEVNDDNTEDTKILRLFIIMTTVSGFALISSSNQTSRDYISLIMLLPIIVFGFIGWIPWFFTIALIILGLIFFLGGNKR